MCLLRPGQTDAQCGHTECKNFYMLNKQACMYNLANGAKAQSDSTSQQSENSIQTTLFSQNRPSAFTSKLSPTNEKRPVGGKADLNAELEAEAGLQEKKLKAEGSTANLNQNAIPLNAFIQNPMALNNQNIDLQSGSIIFPNNLLGNIRPMQNLQGQNQINNSQMVFPLLQNMQNMQVNPINNAQNPINFQNIQFAAAAANQVNRSGFPQASFGGLENSVQFTAPVVENKCTSSHCFEEAFKECEARTLSLLAAQTKMLSDLSEKNELVHDTLACLINEINTLKKTIFSSAGQEKLQAVASTSAPASSATQNVTHQPINTQNETISSEDLLNYLYGANAQFDYQIVLDSDLELPLYRERNFGFTVHLLNKSGQRIENTNKIPLTISIYTCENPPKYIDINTAGNKILKGFVERDLNRGLAMFDKIQIKEVTSHFRSGWIFFIIHPKTNTTNSNVFNGGNGEFVNPQKIRPLILEKVVVKAKKMKEKDDVPESK